MPPTERKMRNGATVAELVAYLNTLPQDAAVEVVVDGCWEYLDLNNEEHLYYSAMEESLFLGNF